MLKIALAGILAISLAGCATPGAISGLPPAPGAPSTAPTISSILPKVLSEDKIEKARKIQADVKALCNFIPTISSIVSVINASYGQTLSTAGEICLAVTSVPLAQGGSRKIVVRGVTIKGAPAK